MTPRSSLATRVAASALLLAAVTPALAANASSDPDDTLDQTIDPNQSQGSGQVVRDQGHIDFGPTLNTGEWAIQIHDDTESPSYWRNPEDVAIRVADAAVLPVPDSEAYSFLGQTPGDEVWVVPQTQKDEVIWVGWNTQEPNVLDALNLGTTLSVLDVEGPGDVVAYLQSGNFGDPEPLWSTFEPFPQQSWIEVNTHTHANWVFSEPGVYLVDIQFDADLTTGESVSARDTLRFAVGDETDPQSALEAEGAAGDAEPVTPAEPADEDPAATETETDGALGMIVWVVVGGVALVLAVAVIVVVTASRRAKARARAARAVNAEKESAE